MDLEIVGRHALLFDDDSMAAFVNSTAALVEWNSLLIDRYDVRHLLSSPPPPRSKRRRANPDDPDSAFASQLDQERYLDLPSDLPSTPDQQVLDDGSDPASAGGYHTVAFSYGNTAESNDQKKSNTESGFRPPFSVPEALLQSLPSTEKVHQIIARTATFVSIHGGQSEIVLRVKQGDNPTFGFLMPDHAHHAYFRFLVDHQELLTGKSLEEDKKHEGEQAGGALSLLGSVYGTGEDEDPKNETAVVSKRNESDDGNDTVKVAEYNESEMLGASKKLPAKEETVSNHPLPLKDKASVIKRNPSVSTVNFGAISKIKKDNDASSTLSPAADKLQSFALPKAPKFEPPIVEPPSDLKKVIDKIVEFILRNGKEFEAVLAEQDVKYGRFPFLLSSNLYHPYYRKVLQEAEETKSSGNGYISEKQEKMATASRESDTPSIGTDIPDCSSKKEKFKMVIAKPKKDVQDQPHKPAQPQIGVTVDAAAAAAILQAARRGIKKPDLGILSSTPLNNTSEGPSSDSSLTKRTVQTDEPVITVPVANAIAKTAALSGASEADSSEVGLAKNQKLKAERLRRAKMFVAMIKGGTEPPKTEPSRSLSMEPADSGVSGSVPDTAAKEREGSSVPFETVKKHPDDDYNERRSKRKYRSRTERDEDDHDEEKEEDTEENRSRRKRHSHDSRDRHRHKHKRRRPSYKERASLDGHKHHDSSDNNNDDEHHHRHSRHRHRHSKSKSSRKHKHDDSSEDEHRRRHRSSKHGKRGRDSEEGEISSKTESDQSKASEGHSGGIDASASLAKPYANGAVPSQQNDTSEVSDELRAKIRAMLTGTL